MSGEITTENKFGTYSKMIENLSGKYRAVQKKDADAEGLQSNYNFYDKEKGYIKANGYKEKIRYTDYNTAMFSNAAIFCDGYTYGTSAKDETGLDKFDYIQGKTQFALDFNGNGNVDSDEIFDGKIDNFVYRQAKSSGDLRNYFEILKQYTK